MGEIATWGKLLQLLMAFWIGRICDHVSSSQKFSDDRSFGGLLTWLVYLICAPVMPGYFFPSLAASAFGALYAEVLARWLKAPSTLFFIVAMIPLIPGSTLYYSMSCAVYGQLAQASIYGLQTFQCALGIGTGMSIVWALCDFSRKMQAWWKERE